MQKTKKWDEKSPITLEDMRHCPWRLTPKYLHKRIATETGDTI